MLRRALRKMAGIKDNRNGKPVDDLGKADALKAQQKVFDQAKEIEASEEIFESKLVELKKRISDTDVRRRKEAENVVKG